MRFRYPLVKKDLPENKAVSLAVDAFAKKILGYCKEMDPNLRYQIVTDRRNNADATEFAQRYAIQGKYGIVVVWPNFNGPKAKACILNRGMIQAMKLEGFSNEEINKNAKIMTALKEDTDNNAQTFATFLTRDLGLQAQKQLEPDTIT